MPATTQCTEKADGPSERISYAERLAGPRFASAPTEDTAMKKLLLTCLLAALPLAPLVAQGTWPDKPITVVVPFGAGGGVDAGARIVMPRLAERLGQQILIENVPGASGTIGTQRVVRAKPDGLTLL